MATFAVDSRKQQMIGTGVVEPVMEWVEVDGKVERYVHFTGSVSRRGRRGVPWSRSRRSSGGLYVVVIASTTRQRV